MNEEALQLLVSMYRLTRYLARTSRTTSLHPTQFIVLLMVADAQPIRIGTIAARVPCSQPTATTTVAALEGAGLVRRQRDAGDGRAIGVVLTGEGERMVHQMGRDATEALTVELDRLDPADRRLVLDAGAVLARMADAT